MDHDDTQKKIAEIQLEIEILNARKKTKDSKCDICEGKGCDVISFIRRKPVHSKCHWREIKRLNIIRD